MLDLGFSEMMLIAAVALVVLGPERLPKVARTVGHLVGRMQRYVNDVKADITREIELDELRKFKQTVEDTATSMQSSFSSLEADARAVGHDLEMLARDPARNDPGLPPPALSDDAVMPVAGDEPGRIAPPAPGHDVSPVAMFDAQPGEIAPRSVDGWFDQDLASVMGSPARPATYGATTALAMTTAAGRLTGGRRWPAAGEA